MTPGAVVGGGGVRSLGLSIRMTVGWSWTGRRSTFRARSEVCEGPVGTVMIRVGDLDLVRPLRRELLGRYTVVGAWGPAEGAVGRSICVGGTGCIGGTGGTMGGTEGPITTGG